MRRAVGTVLLALAVGLTTACGGKSSGPGVASAGGGGNGGASAAPSASQDSEEMRQQFTECMRAHGVDVPDPDSKGGPVRVVASGGVNMDRAVKACQQYLPPGTLSTPDQQTAEKLRQFTQCLRDHGIDVPDPDPNGGGMTISKSGGPGGVNPDDPAFKAAQQACQDKLPGDTGNLGVQTR